MKFQNLILNFERMDAPDGLTFGFLLGTYNVRKSSQESISAQQISEFFYGINLILSLLASFICKFQKFKVPNKGPFMSTDGQAQSNMPLQLFQSSGH